MHIDFGYVWVSPLSNESEPKGDRYVHTISTQPRDVGVFNRLTGGVCVLVCGGGLE